MSLKMRILRAKAERKKRREKKDEERMRKSEIRARRVSGESARREGLSARRTVASAREREADLKLKAQKAEEKEELLARRAAKRTRILTERELRREQLRPYTDVLRRIGKGVVEVGKVGYRGIKKLGEMSKEYERTHPKGEQPLDTTIDLGFGKETPGKKRKPFKEPPIDLDIKIE